MNTRSRSFPALLFATWSLLLYGCHPANTTAPHPIDAATEQAATQHLEAGAKLGDSGQPDAAIAELNEGLRLNPDHAGGHLALGRAYSQKKDSARYEAECRVAIRLKPEWEDPYIDLGQCLLSQHRYDEALVPLGTALQITPNNAFAHYYLGNALNKTGKRTEARQQWQIAAHSENTRVANGAQKQLTRYP